MQTTSNTTQPETIPCAICQTHYSPDDFSNCLCCDLICDDCPVFACSCVYGSEQMSEIQAELRVHAIELAGLNMTRSLMGHDYLSVSQVSRIALLMDVVESLCREWRSLSKMNWGDGAVGEGC